MKQSHYSILAMIAMAALTAFACSDDDDINDTPKFECKTGTTIVTIENDKINVDLCGEGNTLDRVASVDKSVLNDADSVAARSNLKCESHCYIISKDANDKEKIVATNGTGKDERCNYICDANGIQRCWSQDKDSKDVICQGDKGYKCGANNIIVETTCTTAPQN